MPDVITYSCSNSDKNENSHSNDRKNACETRVNSVFSNNELSFYGKETMKCNKVISKDLTNNDSEEVLKNTDEILVSKCNSDILENDSSESELISVNGHENSISDNSNDVNKNVNNFENNLNLPEKDYTSDSLSQLHEPNNVTCNGSLSSQDVESIDNNALDNSDNSVVKYVPDKKENIESDALFKQITNKDLNNSMDVCSNDSSLNSTLGSTSISSPIHLHKDINLVSFKIEPVENSSEIQNTMENTCYNESTCENKIDKNCKESEIIPPKSCNSICQKDADLVEPLIKGDDISLSKNVEKISNIHCQVQTNNDDLLQSNSSLDNCTLPQSPLSENFTKTREEKDPVDIVENTGLKVDNKSSNLKRKRETSYDDEDNYNYKHGNKKLKKVQESRNDIPCLLKENGLSSNEEGIQSLPTCSQSCNITAVTQEKCMNPNELYQGLLNDVLAEDKELIKEPEVVRTKLKRIKRKDLEDMIIDQVMNKVLYDHEIGYHRELSKRLELTLEAANKRALRLTQEIESLRNTTKKVAAEHKRRKSHLVYPTKVKRSVGIQANKSYISQGYSSTRLPNSDVRVIIPTKYRKSKKSTKSELPIKKTKIKSEPSSDVSPIKLEEDYIGISKTIEQKLSTLRKDLINSGSQTSTINKDKKSKSSVVNGKQLTKSVHSMTEFKQESESSSEPTHPAPLPHIPFDEEDALHWKIPPSPVLKVQLRNKSIILSWNITPTYDESLILSYQLFSYEESKEDPPSTDLWQKIGSVKALELPMACTLTQFKCGRVYHFAVRAMTKKGRLGPFSVPKSLRMPPK